MSQKDDLIHNLRARSERLIAEYGSRWDAQDLAQAADHIAAQDAEIARLRAQLNELTAVGDRVSGERERLRAERDELIDRKETLEWALNQKDAQLAQFIATLDRVSGERERLRAENEALRKDAERFRKLERYAVWQNTGKPGVWRWKIPALEAEHALSPVFAESASFRIAIDALAQPAKESE